MFSGLNTDLSRLVFEHGPEMFLNTDLSWHVFEHGPEIKCFWCAHGPEMFLVCTRT